MRSHGPWLAGGLLFVLAGCVPDDVPGEIGRGVQGLAHEGPWLIPDTTLAIGDAQYVEYTGAGAWDEASPDCSGGLEPGAEILGDYLFDRFPQIALVGGYSCRPVSGSTTTMSVHATGRALDLMIFDIEGEADNDLGDPIGNWLIENAGTLGIQYVIWDEWSWMASRPVGEKGQGYGGLDPHHDHLHVELGVEAAMQTVDWFSGAVTEPFLVGCLPVPSEGAALDELDRCFQAFGDWTYWRSVSDAGHGGSLLWTDAWESAAPSNWARFTLLFEETGRYEVEVFLTAPWAVYPATRYAVRHDGLENVVFVDQGATEGWVSLGTYEFSAGGDQSVAVFDDVAVPVADAQHIVVDAIRLKRLDGYDAGVPDAMGDPTSSPGMDDGAAPKARGCATAGEPGGASLLLLLLGALARRRGCATSVSAD